MELTLQIAQFILSISILIFLHELGHYLPAKWFKTRAEKFFLFFDPWFSLFSMKKINGKWQFKFLTKNLPDTQIIEKDGKKIEIPIDIESLPKDDWRRYPESTKWGIGWLPMGGYVKIAGMVDESMDSEQLKQPAKPWEFRSKPAWQRLIIMLGGVTVNFFLAWVIFSALSFFNGETYTDLRKFEKGVKVSESARKMGFQDGDRLLRIDGKEVTRLENASLDLLFSDEATVLRNGKEVTFPIDEEGVAEVVKQRQAKFYLLPNLPGVVVEGLATSTAQKLGLKKDDRIIAVNGHSIQYFEDFSQALQQHKSGKITLTVKRGKSIIEMPNLPVNEKGKLGISVRPEDIPLEKLTTTEEYTFFEAIPRGLERTMSSLTTQVKQFKIIFNSKVQGYKSMGGPVAIVKMMPVEKGEGGDMRINWTAFWGFTAMFSVWLAFLNLLPIPGLDGGHVMFTLWEIITGKPAPQKVLENAQMIGMLFLLGLMLLIFGNDIFRLITGKL